jgi:ribosomal protein L11 methyltransferase
MAWVSLRLAVAGAEAEAVADRLMAAGALTVSIEDQDAGTAQELPQFGEPGLADPKAWARNWLVALLDTDTDVPALLAAAGLAATVEYQLEAVPEQDWVRLTQAQFDPIRISDRLWIVPTWHDAPNAEAINIVLDPGLAFGTGSHPTTRLCLRWLDAHLQAGESLLDYGCGSGILAIAAAKLGAARVWGVDLDPQAVQSAQDNAAANAVDAAFFVPASAPDTVADVVIANILTNPLKALMPLLAARVRVGGRIVLSGILVEQADAVMAIYAEQFVMHRWGEDEGWVCLDGVRR